MDVRETIRVMTRQRELGVVAFVGPEEQCRTEATVAAAWNIPMISYVSLRCGGRLRGGGRCRRWRVAGDELGVVSFEVTLTVM